MAERATVCVRPPHAAADDKSVRTCRPASRPGSARHRLRLLAALSGHVAELSYHPFGCRVVQKLLEVRAGTGDGRD